MKLFPLTLSICAGPTLMEAQAAITIYGPIPYRQQSDSPFYPGIQSSSFFLEDFEDGSLNTPGVSVREGSVREDQGVDEDDGMLDGLGWNMVWDGPSGYLPDLEGNWMVEISFTADALLGLPRFAGVALNGFTLGPPGAYRLNAFDAVGNNLGIDGISVPLALLPPGTTYQSSEGVQFVGFHSDNGISRILLVTNTFDHLQYGWAIPEPGTVTLGGLAAIWLLRRRRAVRP